MVIKALIAKIINLFTCDLIYNGSFTSGNVNLAKSIANYKKLIIVYTDNDGCTHTKTIVTNNANSVSIILDVLRVTGAWYLKCMTVALLNAGMNSSSNKQCSGSNTPTSGAYITIKKIYGCKNIIGGGYGITLISSLLGRWGYVNQSCTHKNSAKAIFARQPDCYRNENAEGSVRCERKWKSVFAMGKLWHYVPSDIHQCWRNLSAEYKQRKLLDDNMDRALVPYRGGVADFVFSLFARGWEYVNQILVLTDIRAACISSYYGLIHYQTHVYKCECQRKWRHSMDVYNSARRRNLYVRILLYKLYWGCNRLCGLLDRRNRPWNGGSHKHLRNDEDGNGLYVLALHRGINAVSQIRGGASHVIEGTLSEDAQLSASTDYLSGVWMDWFAQSFSTWLGICKYNLYSAARLFCVVCTLCENERKRSLGIPDSKRELGNRVDSERCKLDSECNRNFNRRDFYKKFVASERGCF